MSKRKWSKRKIRLLISLALALLLGGGASYTQRDDIADYLSQNQPGLYQVTNVEDGDTISVLMAGKIERVRFIGVDTPELHHPEKPVQCFANAAKRFTTNLIGQNKVRLEADPEDDNRDLYGRLLRYIYLPDGTLVNLELVKQGYGFAYTFFPFVKLEEFRLAEKMAREDKLGLWSGCSTEYDDGQIQTVPATAAPGP